LRVWYGRLYVHWHLSILGAAASRVTAQQLRSASQYFRLELELATRARKPMAVFYYERYRARLDIPTGIYQQPLRPQELLCHGKTPSERRHRLAFESFATSVRTEMAYRAHMESLLLTAPTTVGLLLPETQADNRRTAAARDPGGVHQHARPGSSRLHDSWILAAS
jgi:hypothetical protein